MVVQIRVATLSWTILCRWVQCVLLRDLELTSVVQGGQPFAERTKICSRLFRALNSITILFPMSVDPRVSLVIHKTFCHPRCCNVGFTIHCGNRIHLEISTRSRRSPKPHTSPVPFCLFVTFLILSFSPCRSSSPRASPHVLPIPWISSSMYSLHVKPDITLHTLPPLLYPCYSPIVQRTMHQHKRSGLASAGWGTRVLPHMLCPV